MDSISCLCLVLSILPLHLLGWMLYNNVIRRIEELDRRAGNDVRFVEERFLDIENMIDALADSIGKNLDWYHEPGDDDFEETNT